MDLRKAAFIDRDGVINEERHYLHRKEDFVILPGVAQGIKTLASSGYKIVVISNQAGIARGYYNEESVRALHEYMREILQKEGAHIDAVYYCPHHVLGSEKRYTYQCDCRKPRIGMLLRVATDLNLNLSRSVLIGDKLSDIEAGKNASLACMVLVESGHPVSAFDRTQADIVTSNLQCAASAIAALDCS